MLERINGSATTKVFLVGYPCELGTRNIDGRAGVEKGPASFREIMQLAGYPSDPAMPASAAGPVSYASAVKIYDVGDIPIYEGSSSEFMASTVNIGSQASELRDKIMVEAGKRLQSVIADILEKVAGSRVLVLGGGDELTLSVLRGASDGLPGSGAVLLDPSLDVKP